MSSPDDDDKDDFTLPDPRQLYEELERQERDEALPDPVELFRQLEAESQQEEPTGELGVFGTFEGLDSASVDFPEEDLSLDLPESDLSPGLLDAQADETIGVDLGIMSDSDSSLPDPAELFRQMQEESRTQKELESPHQNQISTPEEPIEAEEAPGLFQRLRNRFTKTPDSPDLDEVSGPPDSEPLPETEHSLPSPEELFRRYQEEEVSHPDESRSSQSTLPTPEELFRQMQEEEMAEARATGSELPQLPDLEEFKRQLEEEEREGLDPDVLTDLSGPERFVPTVSDSIFNRKEEDVLPGFRAQFPVPPPPEPELEQESVLQAQPEPDIPSKPEPAPPLSAFSRQEDGDGGDDFFQSGEWSDYQDDEVIFEEGADDTEVEPEPESPTGTVRVAHQLGSESEFTAEQRFSPSAHQEDLALKRRREAERKRTPVAAAPTAPERKKISQMRFSRYKLAIFTRQMSAMLKAGIQLHSAISFAAESDPAMAPLLRDIVQKVESGYTFSSAILSVSRSFDPVYVGLVQAGEHSGRLPSMLERLADVLEREVEMRKKLVSTITYPAVLLFVCLLGTLGFVFFVLPTLTPLFDDLGVDLPLPTRILLASRDFILPGIALTVLSSILLFLSRDRITDYIRERPHLERRLAAIPFKVPVLGKVYEKIVTSRVLYSLSVMLDVGITLNQALARSESTAGNALTAFRLGKARMDLADGVGVTDCFRFNELFTPSALHLINAGEEAAKLADMFQYVAKLFDEEVEYALEGASSILEPLIMVVMGCIVGFITISAALPTIQLLQNFS